MRRAGLPRRVNELPPSHALPKPRPLWVESSITCQTRCALQPGNVRVRSKNQPVPSLAGTSGAERQPSARSKAFSPVQKNSDLAQGPLRQLWRIIPAAQGRSRQQSAEAVAIRRGKTKRLTPRSTPGSGKFGDRAMSTNDDVQKRNAFAACAEFRIEGLEASLQHAREIALREELGVVGHYIAEAQGYLAQIRLLHQEALDEFSRAQGE